MGVSFDDDDDDAGVVATIYGRPSTSSTSNIFRSGAGIPTGSAYYAIWCRIGDPANPGGHADAFGTSLALHLRPEMVRRDLISNPSRAPGLERSGSRFARHSTSRVIVSPTTISAALGAQLWEAVVNDAARTLYDLAQT